MDINQNIAACIEHTNNIGATVVHNICNGTTQVVPWGSLDWAAAIGVGGFFALFFAFLGSVVYRIAVDS